MEAANIDPHFGRGRFSEIPKTRLAGSIPAHGFDKSKELLKGTGFRLMGALDILSSRRKPWQALRRILRPCSTHILHIHRDVLKYLCNINGLMVDAADSKSAFRKEVGVQVPSPAPTQDAP